MLKQINILVCLCVTPLLFPEIPISWNSRILIDVSKPLDCLPSFSSPHIAKCPLIQSWQWTSLHNNHPENISESQAYLAFFLPPNQNGRLSNMPANDLSP